MNNSKAIVEQVKNNSFIIETFNLTKKYAIREKKDKYITALDNVNLKIKDNEVFGLLGPNGAGKTTLVSILTTLIQPTSGYATILGHNILKDAWFLRENVGLMLGGEMLYFRLSGYKNLKYFCKIYGIKNYKEKIMSIAEKFNLSKWLKEDAGKYSTGMKIKLALARVLLIEPKILFLDEPTTGLDPKSVFEVINILKGLKTTIFITSHQMNVIQMLCDRIAFLKEGKVLKIDTQENFKKILLKRIKIQLELKNDRNDFLKNLNTLPYVSDINQSNDTINFFIKEEDDFPRLFNFLKNFPIKHFNEIEPSLEDVFIKLNE